MYIKGIGDICWILLLLYRCDTHKYGSKKKEKFCYCTQDLCNGAHSNSLGSTWFRFGSIWSLNPTLWTSFGSFDLMILLVLLLLRTLWSEEKKVILCTTRVQKGFLQIHISFHCCTGFVHQVRFAFLIGWTLILEPGSIVHPQEEPPNSKLCITAFQKPLWPSVYSIWISNWIFSLRNLIWEKLGWTFSCHRDDDHHDWLGLNGQDGGRGGVPRLGQCWYLSNGPLHKRRKKRGKKKEKFLHIFFRYETRRSRDVDMLQHNALCEKGNIVGGGPEQFREVGEKDLKCK